jgi:hypothetical protein
MGEPNKIVGIEISQSQGKLSITQRQGIQKILERQGLTNANSVLSPLDPKLPIVPNPKGNDGDRSNAYAQLLGELQFVANTTRPDIAYAVNRLASYMANPSMQHQTAAKHILRYLAGTKTHGITYTHTPDSDLSLIGYADAAHKNRDDAKSTTGYVFLASNGAITWRSGKQTVTALSSTEAEYIAFWEAGKEVSWLRNLYNELGLTQTEPTPILCDNTSAIAIGQSPIYHKRTKHIDPKYHWVREKIEAGRFVAIECRDEDQTADILTKALFGPKHSRHTRDMSVLPVASLKGGVD